MDINNAEFYSEDFTDFLKPSCYASTLFDESVSINETETYETQAYENLYAMPG